MFANVMITRYWVQHVSNIKPILFIRRRYNTRNTFLISLSSAGYWISMLGISIRGLMSKFFTVAPCIMWFFCEELFRLIKIYRIVFWLVVGVGWIWGFYLWTKEIYWCMQRHSIKYHKGYSNLSQFCLNQPVSFTLLNPYMPWNNSIYCGNVAMGKGSFTIQVEGPAYHTDTIIQARHIFKLWNRRMFYLQSLIVIQNFLCQVTNKGWII